MIIDSSSSAHPSIGQAVGAAIAGYALAWAGYNGALKATGTPQPPEVVNRMQQAAGALPFFLFLVAILIMANYPLTEARFREIRQPGQPSATARATGNMMTAELLMPDGDRGREVRS